MKDFVEKLVSALPEAHITTDEPMSRHTSFRIGGNADVYAVPRREELVPMLRLAAAEGVPVTVIGNGSNLLVGDGGVRGLVIEIGAGMNDIQIDGDTIRAGGGALLSKVAQAAANAGLTGMEFAAGIPGSVGGAVVMNAGAYGGEMKDILCSVRVLDASGCEHELTRDKLDLGYRHSCIAEKGYLLVEAVLALKPGDVEDIRSRMAELREQRMSKQPLEYPSAGSTFKRPEGYFAGKLIMDSNLAGYTVGGAQVSEKHCGFVINRGSATASDVRRLVEEVRALVLERYGVELEPEIRMVGEFDVT